MSVSCRILYFALLMGFTGTPASAYDVLVSVTGKLYGNTCIVSSDSKEITVPLGDIGTRQFLATGEVSNIKTPFIINLENCGPTFSGVKIQFTSTPDTDNLQLIKLENGGATGVAVQLLDKDSKLIPINTQTTAYGVAGSETVSMKFFARLAATGAPVTPGAVSALATWVLEYQ